MRFVYKFLLNLLFLYALSLVNVELEHTSLPTTKELLQTKELTDGRSNQCRKYSHIKLVCNYNFSCVYGSEVELYCIDSITNKNCTVSFGFLILLGFAHLISVICRDHTLVHFVTSFQLIYTLVLDIQIVSSTLFTRPPVLFTKMLPV